MGRRDGEVGSGARAPAPQPGVHAHQRLRADGSQGAAAGIRQRVRGLWWTEVGDADGCRQRQQRALQGDWCGAAQIVAAQSCAPSFHRYINGYPDRAPVRPNISLGDSLAGLHAAFGTVMALLHRQRAGGDAAGQVGACLPLAARR